MIDIVITYVNFNDVNWRTEFNKYDKGETDLKRFNRLDLLNQVIKSIYKFSDFELGNIYIVVANKSEIDNNITQQYNVKIIEHKEFIPEKYLPTFNSNTIDLFLYRIPNLSEKFIYFNDDVLLINHLSENEFYTNDNIPKLFITPWHKSFNEFSDFDIMIKRIERLIWRIDIKDDYVLYSDHGPIPMLKSIWKELFEKYENIIYDSITQFRSSKNISIMMFIYYIIKIHGQNRPRLTNKYILVTDNSVMQNLRNVLSNPLHFGYICLNLTEYSELHNFDELKKEIYDCLENYYEI